MEKRVKDGKRQQDQNGGVAHTDFRNLPTGETLSSLYISDQRIPYRRGESSSSSPSKSHSDALRRGSTTPTGTPANTNANANANAIESGDELEEVLKSRTRRRRELSNTSMENNQDDSSTTSMTPSTPPTISSGQSYSGEMHDELTPLREALPPSVSTRRKPITADTGYGQRRNVNASSSYAELPPVRIAPQSRPVPPSRPYDLSMSMSMPSPNPNAGLSEILASPTFREYQASMSPEYTASPFDRPRRGSGSGSGGGSKPATPKDGGSGQMPQIDYFTLPILRDRELDREIERELERDQERPMVRRNASLSSKTSSKSSSERQSGHGHSHGHSHSHSHSHGHSQEGTSTSTPSWSSGDVTSTQSSSLRSPRIRNEGMLAPHGSFTSDSGRQYQARAKLQRAQTQSQMKEDNESVKSRESVSSWRSKAASERSFDGSGRRQYSEEEYLENVQAARGGDQLALYHLGWGQVANNHRHSLGDAGLVWGGRDEPGSPVNSTRSSATSRASHRSNSASGSFPRHLSTGKSHEETLREALSRDGIPSKPRPSHQRKTSAPSDLFADVAHMTLKSNANNNRPQPPPPPPSTSTSTTTPTPQTSTPTPERPKVNIPGPAARPSLFKSASYISSSNLKSDAASSVGKSSIGKKETPEQRKIRKVREKDEGIELDREKDPEKEKEREKRRVMRRAARVTKPEPELKAAGGSTSGSNETEKKK